VRTHCFDDTLSRRGRSHEFVLPCKSLAKLNRKDRLKLEKQLVHWVEHARDRRTRIAQSVGGLGMFTATNVSPNTMLASGDLDADTWWESSGVLVSPWVQAAPLAALGPISLVNAGCDACANARLVPCGQASVELRAGAPDCECTIPRERDPHQSEATGRSCVALLVL
jgi:hypothetical protein